MTTERHKQQKQESAARIYAADPERARRQWREYHRSPKGTTTALLNYARDRAIKGTLPFDIDHEFVAAKLAIGLCEVSGLPVQRVAPGNYRTHPFAPSLDRIIPSLGYTKTNTRLVLFAVNRAMSDWGEGVLIEIAKAIVTKQPR